VKIARSTRGRAARNGWRFRQDLIRRVRRPREPCPGSTSAGPCASQCFLRGQHLLEPSPQKLALACAGCRPAALPRSFHMISCLTEHGRVGLTAVGDSPARAEAIYQRAQRVLESVAAKRGAWLLHRRRIGAADTRYRSTRRRTTQIVCCPPFRRLTAFVANFDLRSRAAEH